MKENRNKENSYTVLSVVTEASNLGFTLAICLGIGVFAGRYIDNWLGTSPWALVICSLLGMATGFWSLYKRMIRNERKSKDNQENNKMKGGDS